MRSKEVYNSNDNFSKAKALATKNYNYLNKEEEKKSTLPLGYESN